MSPACCSSMICVSGGQIGLSLLWVLHDRDVLCMQQHNTDQTISEYVRFPIGYICILPHVKLMWCTKAL